MANDTPCDVHDVSMLRCGRHGYHKVYISRSTPPLKLCSEHYRMWVQGAFLAGRTDG